MAGLTAQDVLREQTRPFFLLRPKLSADGTKWMALYGRDLGSGVAGFGDTPEEAARAFDRAFHEERTPEARIREAAVALHVAEKPHLT